MIRSAVLLLLVVSSPSRGGEADPFAGVEVRRSSAPARGGFWRENFSFKKELMSQFAYGQERKEQTGSLARGAGSRQSVGLEVLKKFSSETATVAAVDFQGRAVRRDRPVASPNDAEGLRREGWAFEHHNAYADLYNILDPFLNEDARGRNIGRFNLRAGRFYLPFGLNLRTDTHGTLLQLANERDLGFERDWYAGLWGAAGSGLNYDAYYLAGSGYDLKFKGQGGLAAARVSLADRYASDRGLEGGVSLLAGERLAMDAALRSPAVMAEAGEAGVVRTLRGGLDGRVRRPAAGGTLTWATELSAGRDDPDPVFAQLHQLDYLRASRRWGLSAQFRRFWQGMRRSRDLVGGSAPGEADASVIGEAAWYFKNDLGSASLHWFKLAVERHTERQRGALDTIATLQYYRYW